ncbi:MAG: hypothetical protein ACKPKO_52300 [Candidatus Fonsibacter sp.]
MYRCILMLKEVFGDGSAFLDTYQDDVMHLIYNSDDLNTMFFFNLTMQDTSHQ